MIILELGVVDNSDPDDETVRFVAKSRYAEGFRLEMPAHEWQALGCPETVQFVVSAEPLGVRTGWVERAS